jgi:hypothetical protein
VQGESEIVIPGAGNCIAITSQGTPAGLLKKDDISHDSPILPSQYIRSFLPLTAGKKPQAYRTFISERGGGLKSE